MTHLFRQEKPRAVDTVRPAPGAARALRLGGFGLATLTACFSSSSASPQGDAGGETGLDSSVVDAASAETSSGEAAAPVDAAGEGGAVADAAQEGAASDGGFGFQPSNVSLSDIVQATPSAKAEVIAGKCSVVTDTATPQADCFASPIEVVQQEDGSKVNLVVVKSLTVDAAGAISATGTVPLVIVSLSNVDIAGSIDGSSSELNIGPGGALPSDTNTAGGGLGGGPAASASSIIGGGGGSYCGNGGAGGGTSTTSSLYGTTIGIRPLVGGSGGGGGVVGGGAGGGAIQISADGTFTLESTGFISVGGQGGPEGGIAQDQNAGGGGSGGSILLEAETMTIYGTLAANGGGGGGDYSGTGGADGTASASAASGGAGGTSDAAGGNGAAAAASNGSPGQTAANVNAGGGGGAAGRMQLNFSAASGSMPEVGGVISPDPSTGCVLEGTLRRAGVDGP
jgi:hypothetical protein